MTLELKPFPRRKTVHWLTRGSLKKRLELLLPNTSLDNFSIVSLDLAGNASFVNFVRHHRLTHKHTGATLDVVEKSIRKIAFISSLEARFYREHEVLSGSVHFQHPTCYGLIETPWESLIFTGYVEGRAPRMFAIAADIARGIAEIETLSHRYLESRSRRYGIRFWGMDFFRLWYFLRPRFNFQRLVPHLKKLGRDAPDFRLIREQLRRQTPALRAMADSARRSPRCFCHMDYLRKNLFTSPQGLHLIDWSEVKVGRIGFDGGAYLSALFRRIELEKFVIVRDEFLRTYLEALNPMFDRQTALRNLHYIFQISSLWHCLRPETILDYQRQNRTDLLQGKYEYLLKLNETNMWEIS